MGPPSIEFLLGPVEHELRRRGCDVARFGDVAAFCADRATLDRADVWMVDGRLPITRRLMAQAPRLRAIVSPWTGTEAFDEVAATDLGVLVANGQAPENVLSVAESTVMLMLAALYDLRGAERRLREGLPEPEPRRESARMMRGRTVGLIGFGQIARAVTRRLEAWEVGLQAYAPRPPASAPASVRFVSLEALMSTSDVVSIHAPLNAETKGLLGADRLRLLKPDAVLINVARGGIVDEGALVALSRERPDFRVAFDVFATEPLPMDSPLRALPNAILTPHAVAHTREVMAELPRTAIESVMRALEGREPLYVRNRAILPRWLERWGTRAV